jgi:hypothetical protein
MEIKEKHRIERFIEKNIAILGITGLLVLVGSLVLFVLINDIVASIFAGIAFLFAATTYIVLSTIVFASKAKSFLHFLFSQQMLSNLVIIVIIVLAGYLGRGQLMDYPYYLKKEFQTYTGVPEEIEIYKQSGKGAGSSTEFTVDSGEVLIYWGILRDLDSDHQYKIEYLPNSKDIVYITDLNTGQKWEHR